jgi:hypothetical protein
MMTVHERALAVWEEPGGTMRGPLPATPADLLEMRRVYEIEARHVLDADDVTFKPAESWGFVFERDGPGIALWRDLSRTLVGFVVARPVGTLGIIAGCCLDPAWESLAIRGRMVACAAARLRACGAQTIGVEVPSDNSEPVATWLDLGFTPTTATIHYLWPNDPGAGKGESASPWDCTPECLALAHRLRPGLDLARDFAATKVLGIGGVEIVEGQRIGRGVRPLPPAAPEIRRGQAMPRPGNRGLRAGRLRGACRPASGSDESPAGSADALPSRAGPADLGASHPD